ncbi:MAG: alpha/beta hydrolase [Spirochaetota bacterium]
MEIENFTFPNSIGHKLAARIYLKDKYNKNGVIFSHGLFSSKDGYKITRMAEDIVNSGYSLMTFDFTYSGESSGNISDISITQEVDDLQNAVQIFKSRGVEQIHLMGSSMGGVVSILAAANNPVSVKSLILIATPLNLNSLIPEGNFSSIQDEDIIDISGVPVKGKFISELRNLDLISAVVKIKCPVCIIHGKLDSVVSINDFEEIKKLLKSPVDSILIEDGDHNLTEERHLNLIKEKVTGWLGKFIL